MKSEPPGIWIKRLEPQLRVDHSLSSHCRHRSSTVALVSKQIAEFTMEHRLPAISFFRRFAVDGGLMAYGPNRLEYTNRSHIYIDKILKGAKPADLPIEQPTKFDFVINLKTAKALGLTIPQSLAGAG